MKNIFPVLLLLIGVNGAAQKPMDSTFASDVQLFNRFFPGSEKGLSRAACQLVPDRFISRVDSFRNYAIATVGAENNGLRKKDIDAFSRMMLSTYKQHYGRDSALTAQYYALLFDDSKPDSLKRRKLDALSKAMITRHFTDAESSRLDSLIFGGLDLDDSALFVASTAYRQMVTARLRRLQEEKYTDTTRESVISRQDMLDKELGSGHVYEYFTYENMDFVLNTREDSALIDEVYQRYLARAKSPSLREKTKTAYKNYKAIAKNAPAPGFAYHDINGKTVSLEQLKGKYVYIDIWATWCGPCKMEIPYLTKLEEDYAGRNIHFVSLSVDKQKDKQAWQNYVHTNQLKGIQLMADKDFESDFIKKFNISYIPRFILIDPAGKIYDANALRPSDAQLRKLLDTLLDPGKPA